MSAAPGRAPDLATIPAEALRLISPETMRRLKLVPFELSEGRLSVAMADPKDLDALDFVRALTGCEVLAFAAPAEAVAEALRRSFAQAGGRASCEALALPPTGQAAEEPRIGERVDRLIAEALKRRASDIHLEPQARGLFVRLRVDGAIRTLHEYPKALQAPITSRVKVLAGMDIAERRLPQDGQFSVPVDGRQIELRVSTLPGRHGEKVVVRILDKSGLSLGLGSLGFEASLQAVFESLVERACGLLLVTGPTGSGKTTTLYAVLNRLKSPLKNVVTLEDPVEYELLSDSPEEAGVTQVQVNPKAGLTFARGLRAVLRQDPDVIMVGEIRDRETAEIAVQAALTGHGVLSTLHTNDATSALERLQDIGIEPFLIASSVSGVLAQRLVRRLCPDCKEGYRPPPRSLKLLDPRAAAGAGSGKLTLYRAAGCERCQKTGYRGRQAIFELLVMTDELRQAVCAGKGSTELRALARSGGLTSLRESGLGLVFQGLTTVEEVFRATV